MRDAERVEQPQAAFVVVVAERVRVRQLEQVEDLQHHPAAERRRQGLDVVAAVSALQCRHNLGFGKPGEVFGRYPAAVVTHVRDDLARDVALVEVHCAVIGDALQGTGKKRLLEALAGLVRGAVVADEDGCRRLLIAQVVTVVAKRALAERADDEAGRGRVDGRLHELRPRHVAAAEAAVRQVEHAQRRRNRGRGTAVAQLLARRVGRDPARRPRGALYDESVLPGLLDQHHRLPGDARAGRFSDAEHERNGDRRVDRVAAGLEYCDARIGCLGCRGRDDAAKLLATGIQRCGQQHADRQCRSIPCHSALRKKAGP